MSFDSEYWSDPDKWKEHTKSWASDHHEGHERERKAMNRFGVCSCGKFWQGEGMMLKCKCGKLVPLKTGEQQIQAGIKAISELAELKRRVERMQAVVEAARKARKWTESQTANDFCDEMPWEQEMGRALAALDASKKDGA